MRFCDLRGISAINRDKILSIIQIDLGYYEKFTALPKPLHFVVNENEGISILIKWRIV
jgi:hypothetical protein